MTRMAAALIGLLVHAGCAPLPSSYPVPEQRAPREGPDPEPLGNMISLADPGLPNYVVSGILPAEPGQTWRWTNDAPQLRVRLRDDRNVRLLVEFAFPEQSHTSLLPITVKYFVNDKLLDTVSYRSTGAQTFSKAVPPGWLHANDLNAIRFEIQPVYIAEADKAKLGMILARAGLELLSKQ